MEMIGVNNLTRDYGSGKGVFQVSFSIAQGEVFGFLGPNGAGKTTTIRHLMGFLRPEGGSCSINGLDCWKNAPEIQKSLGYIPGEIAFFPEMTGLEYLNFLRSYRGLSDTTRMKELMERFEVDARGKIRKMSKGMKQKIAIVAAFMHDPQVLILDEPTSGLDPLMQNRFTQLIQEERERGKTIFMSSHIFEEVEKTCHRICMIKDGKIAALDDPQTLSALYSRSYTVTLPEEAAALDFARDFQGTVDPQNPRQVRLTARKTLEEIFLHYYGEEQK